MTRTERTRIPWWAGLPALGALLAGPAAAPALAAQGSSPKISVEVRVEREVTRVDAQGRTTVAREPVDAARPGDVLVYTLTARNVGQAPAFNARLEDPIPSGTVLIPESVSAAVYPARASLDGGRTWGDFPLTVRRNRPDGTVADEPAPAETYTHLRWLLRGPIPPGGSTEVAFKVRVL